MDNYLHLIQRTQDLFQEDIANHDYWLDIGRPEDYEKAKQDVKFIFKSL